MKQIAIIPARGGSKRLPRKNILPVGGKPMLQFPVEVAITSKLFDEIIVSTEDEEIASIAEKAHAKVDHRSSELATDRSTVAQVCKNILMRDEYADVDIFCCIYPTAILLEIDDLINSRNIFNDSGLLDGVMGVSEYNYPPVQALKKENDYLVPMWPEYSKIQSQFYPQLFVSNGTFYWAKRKAFLEKGSFYMDRLKGYTIPAERAVDINTLQDYEKILLKFT